MYQYRMTPSPFGERPAPAYGEVVTQECLLGIESIFLLDYIRSHADLDPAYLVFVIEDSRFLNNGPRGGLRM